MASSSHAQCLQVELDVHSLAPAGGEFERALGVAKDGQGERLGLSGTTNVNGLCSPRVSRFGLVLTPKAISLVIHPPFSDLSSLSTPRLQGPGHLLTAALQRSKADSQQLLPPGRARGQASPKCCTHSLGTWHVALSHCPPSAVWGSDVNFPRHSALTTCQYALPVHSMESGSSI